MPIIQSDYAKGIVATPYPGVAGGVVAHRFAMAVPTDSVDGDILELGVLPAGCRLIDAIMDIDDVDSGTAIVIDVGIMSGEVGDQAQDRTCGDEILDGVTTGQTGGVVRPTLAKAFRIDPAPVARSVGVKIVTDAGTAVAGNVGLTLIYAAP